MVAPIYPDIPDPDVDPAILIKTVDALKTIVETLLGQRGTNGWATQTFFQRDEPVASKMGDQWIRPALLAGEVDIASIWTGKEWRKLTF